MKLSMRIRIARQRVRMSQEALAAQLGVTRGAVANWECAMGAMPASARLQRLAQVTGVNFEWLATGRGAVAYPDVHHDVPAVDAELVHDPEERQLLAAFRAGNRQLRRMLLGLAEINLGPAERRSA